MRWGALAFGLFQLYQYFPVASERAGAPSKGLWIILGLSLLTVFALGNAAATLLGGRIQNLVVARRVSLMTIALDLAVTIGFVFLFAFDAGNAIWVILYVIPLEGALRFQLRGSLVVMGVGVIAYTASRYWGHLLYGHDFLPFSITFRMGIGLMIAIIAGVMAKGLLAERNRLHALHESANSLASSLKTREILHNLSVAATNGVGAIESTVHLQTEGGQALPVESERVMAIPIEGRSGEVLGVLSSHFDRKPKHQEDHRPFLGSLANAAAVALENARLYEQVEMHSQELEERVRERTIDLEQARLEILRRLALAAEFRDYETGEHTVRVGTNSARLAEAAGLKAEEVEILKRAAPLHDVGKIGVSDTILLKPGRLSDEERLAMQRHTRIGADILSGSNVP
ncbi:MAG TPA: HD domain-containing protein, partial [Actinomycetota bacterium]|nr:HD domain-containing protein [Actinomycetota bacterium]